MTVAELIQELLQYPQDYRVVVDDNGYIENVRYTYVGKDSDIYLHFNTYGQD